MELNVGEQVYFRASADTVRYDAMVSSVNDKNIVIRANVEVPQNIKKGDWLIISLPETEFYTEIINRDNNMFSVKKLWCDRREYFRVDDVFPVSCKKISKDRGARKTRMVSGAGPEQAMFDMPGESINPQLWNMLVDINTKLGLILNRLNLQADGFLDSENRQVNISATGMKVRTHEKAQVGDTIEIKMLLPTYPQIGIVAFGRVVRVDDSGDGEYDIALHFEDMDEDVRDEIIQYAIKRQRDVIRSQRQKEK